METNTTKSKHVSMPGWMMERTENVALRTGAPFSKLVQIALEEKLPEWELKLGSFQIAPKQTYEERVKDALRESRDMSLSARLNQLKELQRKHKGLRQADR